jgi:hypothetical protein
MLNIPYVPNPDKACALACYAMTAKYFFPGVTFQQLAKITQWQPGYVIWAFKFWFWIMNKGVRVTDYDLISLQAWADEGVKGLKKTVSSKEFQYYQKNSHDLETLTEDIRQVLKHPNFTYYKQKPTFPDLQKAFDNGGICEVVLNARKLDNREGFSLHRVVILDINEDSITFHDPRKPEESQPARKESIQLFVNAWLEAVSEPELCIYAKN